jgi:hypothetical protein
MENLDFFNDFLIKMNIYFCCLGVDWRRLLARFQILKVTGSLFGLLG